MIVAVFEMHTFDPDGVFALCLLATHPQVNLQAVALYPGNRVQAGVIYSILERLDGPIKLFRDVYINFIRKSLLAARIVVLSKLISRFAMPANFFSTIAYNVRSLHWNDFSSSSPDF
jgi:hypothetical protein